jgi:REP element-mobilizing transposase RayT
MLRGNERKNIFIDEEDKNYFLNTLQKVKENCTYELYAYCLMDNHVHLLIQERTDGLQRTMKRIGVIYSYYFNKKYQRIGHLFQDRYRSETVEKDTYVLAAARYIHNNPVEAGIVKNAEEYKWSSYQEYIEYINNSANRQKLADVTFLLSMLSDKMERAITRLEEFTKEIADDKFIDCGDSDMKKNVGVSTNLQHEVTCVLQRHGYSLEEFRKCSDKSQRNSLLREIKEGTCGSIRELARIMELSKDIIFRA